MRAYRHALLCLATAATLSWAAPDGAFAQKYNSGGASRMDTVRPTGPRDGGYQGGGRDGGRRGGGYRPGYGAGIPGIMVAIPPGGGRFIDDGTIDGVPQGRRAPSRRTTRRGPSGAPPANERRMVPDEVLIKVAGSVTPQQINALQARHRLTRVETLSFEPGSGTLFRWRIPDRRSVAAVVRALEGEAIVAAAQPNYLYRLQQSETPAASEGDPAQYELGKLRLPQAHGVSKGDNIPVAVIDSAVDAGHPDLAGSLAQAFNATGTPVKPDKHGTAIAGLIAAHGRLIGAAPGARILAIRAFDPAVQDNDAMTTSILKGIYWATDNGARVINMSFAGPRDPELQLRLETAHKKGVVLVAASGNNGPKAAPQYPAAYADVIAVGGTDADDKLFELSVRGSHIAVAAPAEKILIAIPDGGYAPSSGTSYSAAEVSGIVALMLARNPRLTPDKVRAILMATAKDLGPKGRDVMFGAGLVDAYAAITAEDAPVASATPGPVERVSTGKR
jgi:hypothetical protein